MRNLGLDLLRILAVSLVLGRHLNLRDGAPPVLLAWQRGGWIGVDLFFVLSGFLVSGLLFKEHQCYKTIDIKRFLIRRGFKIYPAFWSMIVFTILMCWVSGKQVPLKGLLGEVFFLQNYIGGIWDHTWSLAIEEHFYFGIAIVFGIVVHLKPGHGFSGLPRLFVILAILCLILRVANLWISPDYSHPAYLYPSHLRIDSLFFGVFLSYLYYYHSLMDRLRLIPSWALLLFGVILMLPAFIYALEDFKWVSIGGVILFYIGSGCLVVAAVRLGASNNRFLQLLGVLGSTSYSIYLWHLPVNTWGIQLLKNALGFKGFTTYFIVYFFGSMAFGYLMSKLIEWPGIKVRDLLFPSLTRQGNVLAWKTQTQSEAFETHRL